MIKIPIFAVCIIMSAVIGFGFGRITANVKSSYTKKIYENIEDYVLLISGIVVLLSIVFSTMGIVKDFASIATNINTCKMDWYDMMSNDQQNSCRESSEEEEYGTVDIVVPNMNFNQEDA